MKQKYFFTAVMLAAITGTFHFNALQAQTTKQKEQSQVETVIKKAIDSQRYTFKAQTMMPMNGLTRQLNADYDLSISSDEVISFLPYMGRIYTPPIDPSAGPLRFTSKDFTYNAKTNKKGGWDISIKPKDVNSVREFNLSVSVNGYATLQVSGNDRQPITFYGYILQNG